MIEPPLQFAYAVTTWSGARLVETLHSIPAGSRCLIIDNSQPNPTWPLARAWNFAIRRLIGEEGYDAVVVCNDDILVNVRQPAPHQDRELGEVLADALIHPDRWGWSPEIGPEPVMVTGYNLNPSMAHPDPENMRPDEGFRWRPHPDFSCFCVSSKIVERVGYCWEGFNPCYFEDNDWHRRIQLAGVEAYSLAPYFHYGSSTVRYDGERKREVDLHGARLRQLYRDRWGGDPGKEVYRQPAIT